MANRAGLIDRDGFVLIIIDMQERLAAAMTRGDEVIARAIRLVRLAELMGAPIIVTRQYPEGLGDTVPELRAALTVAAARVTVATVDKLTFCACDEPGFADALREAERPQAVVAGMESHICVTQTALMLARLGTEVHIAADACCSRRDEDRSVAYDRLRAAGVIVTTSESVMYEAVAAAGTYEFKELLAIVKGA